MVIKEGVSQTLRNVNNKARDLVNQVKDTYDYLSGNRSTRFNYTKSADATDLERTALKDYVNQLDVKEMKKDPKSNMLQIMFDARKAPRALANRVNPDNQESNPASLYNYIVDYEDHIVTMELPMDDGKSADKKLQKNINKRKKESLNEEVVSPLESALMSFETGHRFERKDFNSDKEYEEYIEYMNYGPAGFYEEFSSKLDFSDDFIAEYGFEEESVMTPVPIPYKGLKCDKNGKTLKENSEDDDDAKGYTLIDSKSVQDVDGFYTDYTLYYDGDKYFTIFGDNDIYTPENSEFDFETESESDALAWFKYYKGFADDDLDESVDLLELKDTDDSQIEYKITTRNMFADLDKFSTFDLNDKFYDLESAQKYAREFEKTCASHMFVGIIEYKDGNPTDRRWELRKGVFTPVSLEESSDLLELKIEEDTLEETPGLTLSEPQVKYRDAYDYEGYLEIEINGKKYKYVSKIDKTAAEMADKVSKMKQFSDGKALAFLKKNMQLAESAKCNRSDLESELESALLKVMMSPEFGYPEDEAKEYSGVKLSTTEEGYLKVEVHAEVGYDGLWTISEELNKIVDKYDSDSYFDMECPGRIVAYLDTELEESLSKESLTESTEGTEYKVITIKLRDPDNSVENLINAIKGTANPGHSFPVVIDPDDSDYRQEFYIDGDGSDYIADISVDKVVEESAKKFSFKDHHLCTECGKPLSQCECEIKEESLNEEATQTSDIGQHKVDSIDLIPGADSLED